MKPLRWALAFLTFVTILALVSVLLVVARRTDPLPNPNGYDDFVAAGALVVGAVPDIDGAKPDEIRLFATQNAAMVARVRTGLAHESRVPVSSDPNNFLGHLAKMSVLKKVGDSLRVVARQAALEGDLTNAVAVQLDRARMGINSVRGGLVVDYAIGLAIERGALGGLQRLTNQLDAALCRQVLQALTQIEATRVPLAAAERNDRRWNWFESGWWQSWEGVKEQSKSLFGDRKEALAVHRGFTQKQGEVIQAYHDLFLALARRAFTLEKGRPPANDAELVPEYLPALPPK